METRPLGGTALAVTPICIGGPGIGSMPAVFGYDVPAERGVATARRVLAGPVNFLDTAAGYSEGESERRIGTALRAVGGLPPGFVLSTKVDPDPRTGDYSGEQVHRSAEQSLERLGVDRFQLLHLHDPEVIPFDDAMAPKGPVEALVRLREQGVAQHLGVAGGPVELMSRFVRTGVFDVLLTHNRWTLLDRSAGPLIDEAVERGLGVMNAAPFGGGLLARGAGRTGRYAYRDAPAELLRRVREMEQICREYDVPLAAAALQFSTRDPRIGSTVVGVSRPERVDETVTLASLTIPEPAWERLERLAAPESMWQH